MATRSEVTSDGSSGGNFGLDVKSEVDPLHLYRPINDATHTTLVGGKVSVLKDQGRSGTLRDLSQAVDANRFTHGVDANGKDFMQSSAETIWLDAVAAVDWEFMHNPLGLGGTIAGVIEVTSEAGLNTLLSTGASTSDVGIFFLLSGSDGTRYSVNSGGGPGTESLKMDVGVLNNGATPAIFSFLCRHRDSAASNGTNEGFQVDATVSLNGVELLRAQPKDAAFTAGSPSAPLRLGAVEGTGTIGIRGKVYEIVLDNRWWSDDLVNRYHRQAAIEYGAGNMIR